MKVFDFNVHPSGKVRKENSSMSLEASLSLDEYRAELEDLDRYFLGKNYFINLMLFNVFLTPLSDCLSNLLKQDNILFSITALVNFRRESIFETLESFSSSRSSGIKFHSYFQRITEEDFPAILRVAKYAEKKGMFICVDTSYGTSGMYRFDNMKLACVLADEVSCPIILLHSGGLRVLEAMLLAEDKPHVFLETSFSLPYYQGSTIEEDIVFAYKKLGPSRLIYGSDYPYVDFDKSKRIALEYFAKCGFSDEEIQAIMFDNAFNLVGK